MFIRFVTFPVSARKVTTLFRNPQIKTQFKFTRHVKPRYPPCEQQPVNGYRLSIFAPSKPNIHSEQTPGLLRPKSPAPSTKKKRGLILSDTSSVLFNKKTAYTGERPTNSEKGRLPGVSTGWNICSTAWNKCSKQWKQSGTVFWGDVGFGLLEAIGRPLPTLKQIAYTKVTAEGQTVTT